MLVIEVKTTRMFELLDLRRLVAFLAGYPKSAPSGLLLYDSDEVLHIGRIVPAPC